MLGDEVFNRMVINYTWVSNQKKKDYYQKYRLLFYPELKELFIKGKFTQLKKSLNNYFTYLHNCHKKHNIAVATMSKEWSHSTVIFDKEEAFLQKLRDAKMPTDIAEAVKAYYHEAMGKEYQYAKQLGLCDTVFTLEELFEFAEKANGAFDQKLDSWFDNELTIQGQHNDKGREKVILARDRIKECFQQRNPVLDLENLGLKTLPKDCLGELKELVVLNINGNRISELELMELPKLAAIDAGGNPLTKIEFNDIEKLQWFNASGAVQPDSFSTLSRILEGMSKDGTVYLKVSDPDWKQKIIMKPDTEKPENTKINQQPADNEFKNLPIVQFTNEVTRWANIEINKAKTGEEIENVDTAARNIIECYVNKDKTLNLKGLGLASLPEAIKELTQLTELNLDGNALNGDLPSSISNLVKLETLDLKNNRLTGLGTGVANLGKLKNLDLSGNHFQTLPAPLPTKLQKLNISNNRISSLPNEINLNQLEWLDLSSNTFDRPIDHTITGLTSLKHLLLNGNRLVRPGKAISFLKNLETLEMANNEVTFDFNFSKEISNLENLQKLVLRGNRISRLNEDIVDLKKLKILDLSCNQFSGIMNEWVSKLISLEELNLSGNQLTGVRKDIINLKELASLDLSKNNLSAFPSEILASENKMPRLSGLQSLVLRDNTIKELPNEINLFVNTLTCLDMKNNPLTSVTEKIYDLIHLKVLDLGGHILDGLPGNGAKINEFINLETLGLARDIDLYKKENNNKPKEILIHDSLYDLKGLVSLDLSGWGIKSFPIHEGNWQNLSSLKKLYLRNNAIKELPEELFAALDQLEVIDTENNPMKRLPDNINALRHLEEIRAGYEKMEEFPRGISQLSKLRTLSINGATDKIVERTERFTQFFNLLELNLSNCNLSASGIMTYYLGSTIGGKIRGKGAMKADQKIHDLFKCIVVLTQLETLILVNNHLNYLPEDIQHLINLKILNISGNQLFTLPDGMRQLKALEYLDMSDNLFEKLPEVLAHLTGLNKINMEGKYNKIGLKDGKKVIKTIERETPFQLSVDIWEQQELLNNPFNETNIRIAANRIRDCYKNKPKSDTLHLQGLRLTSLPAIDHLNWLKTLNLKDNKLKNMPNLAELASLEKMDLSENVIESLAWKDLPSGLDFLDLSRNRITTLTLPGIQTKNGGYDDMVQAMSHLKNLRVLKLADNKLKTVPMGLCHLKGLEELDMEDNQLITLPDDILRLRDLKKLLLNRNNLVSLTADPELALNHLRHLNTLELSQNQLTDNTLKAIIQCPAKIQRFKISNNKIKDINNIYKAANAHMASLEYFDASKNPAFNGPVKHDFFFELNNQPLEGNRLEVIKELVKWGQEGDKSESLDRIKAVRRVYQCFLNNETSLDLSQLQTLSSLPEKALEKLTFLLALDLEGCEKLKSLKLSRMPALQNLNLGTNDTLTDLDLSGLTSLKILNLDGCEKLKSLKLSQMPELETLFMGTHENLTDIELSGLISLEILSLDWFEKLKSLKLSQMPALKELSLSRNKSLTDLNLSGVGNLTSLILPALKTMKTLNLKGYEKLEELDLSRMESLESLDVSGCKNLTRLILPSLKTMKALNLKGCEKLEELDIFRMESLENLDISGCKNLIRLKLPSLKTMKTLDLKGYEKLEELDLSRVASLESLDINGCKNLTSLILPALKTMKTLDLKGYEKLEELDLSRMESLESLDLSGCKNLIRLKLPPLKTMKTLELKGYEKLEELDLSRMESLESLDLSGCKNLTRLKLPSLKTIKTLNLKGCEKLENLDLSRMNFLESLDLSECKNLAMLKGIEKLTGLRKLRLPRHIMENLPASIRQLPNLEVFS